MRCTTILRLNSLLLAGLLASGCVSKAKYDELYTRYITETDGHRQAIGSLERHKTELERDSEYYRTVSSAKDAELDALKAKLNLAELKGGDWEAKLRAWELQNPGAKVGAGGQYVHMPADLIFDAGMATLKKAGTAALDGLVGLIQDQNAFVRIDGHTDSDPIQRSKGIWRTGSNFELGAHRALSVLLHLQQKGIAPDRMFLASFGEHRPVDSAAKARNRRVEIYFFQQTSGGEAPKKGGETPPEESGS